jgi:hypothetical protein
MFRKLVTAVVLVLALVVPASGISDIGRSEITRIWTYTEEGKRFACSASYVFPYIDEYHSWILTAGHCTDAVLVARNAAATTLGIINWRASVNVHGENGTQTVDIALGIVPDVRRGETARLWLASTMPERGEGYIHGYPQGVEVVTRGLIAPSIAGSRVTFKRVLTTPFGEGVERTSLTDAFPGTRFMIVPPGQLGPGSSGSAILDGNDRVIAVLWGGLFAKDYEIQGLPEQYKDWDVILVTPVDVVHALFKNLGIE